MKKLIVIILVLIGFSSYGQTYLVQPAKWRFTNSQRFDSTVRFYNLPILTGDTVIGFNPYSKKIGLKVISSAWSTSGNTFSNGNYLGTSNNRGLPIVINGKKQVYFDTLAGINLYDRNASRILSIYKNNSATTRSGTVYNSRPDSTNSTKAGHIFIAGGANISGVAGANYATVALEQDWLATTSTGIASSLRVSPTYIVQSSGSGYISGITVTANNTIGGSNLYYRGLDIPSCGNNSNSYGIHQADAVGRNYFAASTQFGSTTTSTSAQVQINSTTKGFLPPVMTNAQKNAISSPSSGLVVYDNGTNKLNYYNGSSWRGLDSSSSGGSYTAGQGLTLNSNTFRLDTSLNLTWTGNKTIFNSAISASANYGRLSIGAGAFNGSTSGFFTGNSAGTSIAVNEVSGYTGDLMNLQINGVNKIKAASDYFQVTSSGQSSQIQLGYTAYWGESGIWQAEAGRALALGSTGISNGNNALNMYLDAGSATIQVRKIGSLDYNFRDLYGRVRLGNTSYPWKSFSASIIDLPSTITAGGTTGNQTINKITGTVNIAAAGTTVTVTNSLVTASSIVYAVIRTGDATATIKNVVPASGSFVINLAAAATSEVSIGFIVFNQ